MYEDGGWNETAAGTGSGATATKTNAYSRQYLVATSLSGHTDADGLVTLYSGSGGTTVMGQWYVNGATTRGFNIDLPDSGIAGTRGHNLLATIASSTSDCQVNLAGHHRTSRD